MILIIFRITAWFIRIVLVLGLIAVAFAAVYNLYRNEWTISAVLLILLGITYSNVRTYLNRETHAVVGPSNSSASAKTRLAMFWGAIGISVACAIWAIRRLH